MTSVRVSELEYQGRIDGRHVWELDGGWYYWTDKSSLVTSDLAGREPFCRLQLLLVRGGRNTIRALTKADAKRAIVEKLNGAYGLI